MAKARNDLTGEYVREALCYDPVEGTFRWRSRPVEHFSSERARNSFNSQHAGEMAGYVNQDGYVHITLNRRAYQASRLAYVYMTGSWPADMVDHKNGDTKDNRWENLRDATNSQNQANRKLDRRSKSGLKGVAWRADKKRWWARGFANQTFFHLGYYRTKEEAAKAYADWAASFLGEFARCV